MLRPLMWPSSGRWHKG